jgi:hypothetical protein
MKMFRASLILAVATAGLLLPAGCNIVTPIVYAIEGPGQIDAELVLEDRPTVVFIDDRSNLLSPITLRRDIADTVSKELMRHAKLTVTIRPVDAMAVARRLDTNDEPMAIDRIAREVGAEQIIYVQMLAWRRTPDGFTPRPTAACSVQVIDAMNSAILYPPMVEGEGAARTGRTVQTMLQPMPESAYDSRAAIRQLQETLAQELGGEIAKLFYKHERIDLGGNLNSR